MSGEKPGNKRQRGAAPYGERLRQLREAAGLTQEELASRARLTAKAVSALERGERKRPYPHTVRSLADALELSEGERASLTNAIPSRSGGAPVPDGAATVSVSALPVFLTPLLGRKHEVQEVVGLLLGREEEAAAAVRLLTLTGPGGIGKSRLALRGVAGEVPGARRRLGFRPAPDPPGGRAPQAGRLSAGRRTRRRGPSAHAANG